jgi:Raf kinase inhibitor-like YbhB/YbcL family protein
MRCEGMRFTAVCAALIVVLGACGGGDDDGDGSTNDGPAIDGPDDVDGPAIDAPDPIDGPDIDAPIDAPAAFALTSTAITEGGVIPDMYSCQGVNVSPPLAWTGGPTAPGYALVFTDITNTQSPFLHSIIWDIPGNVMSLPENVEKVYMPPVPAGSKQPIGYNGQTRGYLGPCPGSMHRYEFALYAVDVYPLPGLGMSSTRTQVRDVILAHDTAVARLTATFTP